MKLFLIRHGERGRYDKFDTLTWLGIEQSKRLGPYFKDKKIDIVYCSPQKRAKDTFKYIKPYLNKKVPVKVSEQVRQQSAPEEVGEEVVKKLKLKIDTDFELDKRVQKFLEFLKKNHSKDNVLISTHKQFVLSAVCRLLNLPPTEKIMMHKIHSASVTYFELDSKFDVKDFRIGDITHLAKFAPEKIKQAQKSKQTAYPISIAVINKKSKDGIKWLKSNYPVKEIKKDKNDFYFEIDLR